MIHLRKEGSGPMKKLGKYLKPFALVLAACVVLLFAQALCDLNLPNYMSDIVNVGIQQSGIDHAAPEAVSQNGLKLMTAFMTDGDRQIVRDHYTLVSTGGSGEEYDNWVKQYPLLAQEDIYLRQTDSSEELSQLDDIFGKAGWTMINTFQDMAAQTEGQGEQQSLSSENMADIDITTLYPMIPALEQIPSSVMDSARQEAEQMQQSMRDQTGAVFVKLFYQELGMDVGGIQMGYILRTGLLMLLIALGGIAATILVTFFASRVSAGVAKSMRRDLFHKVESFSSSEFDQYSTASLITRTTNDITQVQMLLVIGIRILCYAPIIGIGGTIMALNKSSSMAWVIALACVLLMGVMLVLYKVAMPKFKSIQKLIDKLNLVSRENLNGLMVIRAFGTQEFEKKRFDTANQNLTKTNLFVNRTMALMMPVMMFIMNGLSLLIVWVGSHQIAQSTMQVGDMMAFIQYAMQIIMAFLMISMMFIMIPRAAVSLNRVAEVLDTKPVILDPEHPKEFDPNQRGVVEFKHVNFRYNGAEEDVLHDITFTAKPGQTTAFIGSTGSGKSTLINLIPRFYDVTGGEILVNGVNIKDVPQKLLREQIGYVPQKGVLLSGTIASNLRYGDENASDEHIQEAAEVAQAMDFISQKEDGFQSEISEGGSNVSGGQKQRLSIARALVKNSPIYIFDDSFSALDFKTDAALRKALKKHTSNSTMLIVAQRVSTIMQADQIIVLDEGRIAGMGTHQELLKNCPVYYEIASSQLSKEELE